MPSLASNNIMHVVHAHTQVFTHLHKIKNLKGEKRGEEGLNGDATSKDLYLKSRQTTKAHQTMVTQGHIA